jgi:hypothetical protein
MYKPERTTIEASPARDAAPGPPRRPQSALILLTAWSSWAGADADGAACCADSNTRSCYHDMPWYKQCRAVGIWFADGQAPT